MARSNERTLCSDNLEEDKPAVVLGTPRTVAEAEVRRVAERRARGTREGVETSAEGIATGVLRKEGGEGARTISILGHWRGKAGRAAIGRRSEVLIFCLSCVITYSTLIPCHCAGEPNCAAALCAASATAPATARAAAASGESSPPSVKFLVAGNGDGENPPRPPTLLCMDIGDSDPANAPGGRNIDDTPRPRPVRPDNPAVRAACAARASSDPTLPTLPGVPPPRDNETERGDVDAARMRCVSSSCCRLTQALDVSASTRAA